jgi:hypothetical protein
MEVIMSGITWDLERMKQAYLSLAAELGRPPLRQDLDQAAAAEPDRMPSSTDYDLLFKGRQWLKQLTSQVQITPEPADLDTEALGEWQLSGKQTFHTGKQLPYTEILANYWDSIGLRTWLSKVTPEQLNEYLGATSTEWGVVGYVSSNGFVNRLRVVPVADLKSFRDHHYNFALRLQQVALDIQIGSERGVVNLPDLRVRERFGFAVTAKYFNREGDHLNGVTLLQSLNVISEKLPERWALVGSVSSNDAIKLSGLRIVEPDEKPNKHEFKLKFRTSGASSQLVAAEGAGVALDRLVFEIVEANHTLSNASLSFDSSHEHGFSRMSDFDMFKARVGRALHRIEYALFWDYSRFEVSVEDLQFWLSRVSLKTLGKLLGYLPQEFALVGRFHHDIIVELDMVTLDRMSGSFKMQSPKYFKLHFVMSNAGLSLQKARGAGAGMITEGLSLPISPPSPKHTLEFVTVAVHSGVNADDVMVEELQMWLSKVTPEELRQVMGELPEELRLVGWIHSGGKIEGLKVVTPEAMAELSQEYIKLHLGMGSTGLSLQGVSGKWASYFAHAMTEARIGRKLDPIENALMAKRLGFPAESVTVDVLQSWLPRVTPEELRQVLGDLPEKFGLVGHVGSGGKITGLKVVTPEAMVELSSNYLKLHLIVGSTGLSLQSASGVGAKTITEGLSLPISPPSPKRTPEFVTADVLTVPNAVRQALLDDLRAISKIHGGRRLTETDLDPELGVASAQKYAEVFGSFGAALAAAGLALPVKGKSGFVTLDVLAAPFLAPIDGARKLIATAQAHAPQLQRAAEQTLRGGAIFFLGSLGADALDAMRSGDWNRLKSTSVKDLATDYAALTIGGEAGRVATTAAVSRIPARVMPAPLKSLGVRTGSLTAAIAVVNRVKTGEWNFEHLPQEVATILAASGLVQGATSLAARSPMLRSAGQFLKLTTAAGKATFLGAVATSIDEFALIREISRMELKSAAAPAIAQVRESLLQLLHADAEIQRQRRAGEPVDEPAARAIRVALKNIQQQLAAVPSVDGQLRDVRYQEQLQSAADARDSARVNGLPNADWNYSRRVAQIHSCHREATTRLARDAAKDQAMALPLSAAAEFHAADDGTMLNLPDEHNETRRNDSYSPKSLASLLQTTEPHIIAQQLKVYLEDVSF